MKTADCKLKQSKPGWYVERLVYMYTRTIYHVGIVSDSMVTGLGLSMRQYETSPAVLGVSMRTLCAVTVNILISVH